MEPSEDAQRGGDEQGGSGPDTWERFARHLIDAGVLTAAEFEALREDPEATAHSLPEVLLLRGRCDAERLRRELAGFFGVEAVAAEDIPLDPILMENFPGDVLMRHGCVPLTLVGTTLRVAMVDPSNQEILRVLRGLVWASVWPVVALERDVVAALVRLGVKPTGGGDADGGGGGTGDTAFEEPLQRAGEALAAGHPADALPLLEAVVQGEPSGRTLGGHRLSFASVEEQHVYQAEHPDAEVDWVDPAWGFARYLRGVALGDLGRLEEACGELELAVEWNPVSDRAHLELGWVRAQLGRHEEAAAAFARAAALYEASNKESAALALRGRGYSLTALGRVAEAADAYRRSLTLEPRSDVAHHALIGLGVEPDKSATPASAEARRLAAATAAGTLVWHAVADPERDERGFSCAEGGRTITVTRRGKWFRLAVREAAAGGDAAERLEEEQEGLLKRSRSLKPLFEVVARYTRVLER